MDILLSHDAIVFGLHFDAGKAMLKERGYALFTALCGLDFKRQDTRDKLQRIYEECQSCGFYAANGMNRSIFNAEPLKKKLRYRAFMKNMLYLLQ